MTLLIQPESNQKVYLTCWSGGGVFLDLKLWSRQITLPCQHTKGSIHTHVRAHTHMFTYQRACFFLESSRRRECRESILLLLKWSLHSFSLPLFYVNWIIISFKVDHVIKNKTMPQRWTWKDAFLLSCCTERGELLRVVLHLEGDKTALNKYPQKSVLEADRTENMKTLWSLIYCSNIKLKAKPWLSVLNHIYILIH